MHHLRQITLAALLLGSLSSAQAITIQLQPQWQLSADSDLTTVKTNNRSVELQLPQFDSRLGTLNQVTLTLFGQFQGSAKAESVNNGARQVTLNLGVELSLWDPETEGLLLQATPLVSNSFQASTYDGTSDFGGSSGRSFTGLTAAKSSTRSFSDAATLAHYTGAGMVTTLLSARGASGYVSSGNIDARFSTQVSGYARVTYDYQAHQPTVLQQLAPVPEPSTWALMFAGLAVVGALAKRRAA